MAACFDRLLGRLLIGVARLLTGAYAHWNGCSPTGERQRLYFANHSSHLDFLLLWALLPPRLRYRTRPVAGADYWKATPLRRYLIQRVFRGVLVDRVHASAHVSPLEPLQHALDAGDSLIFFPEGTRSASGEVAAFKPGLYHLARSNPDLELVPVCIENLNRVLGKGDLLPVPLICTLGFGTPLALGPEEGKAEFLARARQAVVDQLPKER